MERISEAEHAVMEVLWDESPLTAAEVATRVPAERKWSDRTVKTPVSYTHLTLPTILLV